MSLVQYVVVRGDLLKKLGWPVGAVIAQACHACTAVTHEHRDDEETAKYLTDLDRMHKVVLEAPDGDALTNLAELLKKNDVIHRVWIEQPENFPTCLATKPYAKEKVQSFFKKFKLFK
eukprot:m.311496 g.311496  ORF g.311496 m.311496 type:complete len:118 (+) comp73270_c0_seq1:18-371(+)